MIGAATAVLGDLAEMHGLTFEVADRAPLESPSPGSGVGTGA